MKSSKVIAATLILMMSAVFAMSGDGGQKPVKPEKKTEVTQVQNEQSQQADNAVQGGQTEDNVQGNKSTGTVKDKYKIDTGLNEKEYQEQEEAYIQKYMELKNSVIGEKKYPSDKKENEANLWWRKQAINAFEERLNLNAIPKLKKYGVEPSDFFSGYDVIENFSFGVVMSPIIVHGKITDMTNKENEYGSAVYDLEVYDVLKGQCFFDKKPDLIKVSLWNKRDYKIGNEIIAFLGFRYNVKHNKNNITDESFRTVGTQLIIIDNKIYDGFIPGFMPDTRLIGSIDEVKQTIKEISEIVDFENFFKIDWKR